MKSDSVHQAVAHDGPSASELAASPVVDAATTTQDAPSMNGLAEWLRVVADRVSRRSLFPIAVKQPYLRWASEVEAAQRQLQPAVEIQRGTV